MACWTAGVRSSDFPKTGIVTAHNNCALVRFLMYFGFPFKQQQKQLYFLSLCFAKQFSLS